MNSVLEFFSNSGYTFFEGTIFDNDARCHTCNKSATGSVVYMLDSSFTTISVYLHEHPLCLKDDVIFGEDASCRICSKPAVGSPTYTCVSDGVDCQNFYLHKICAELPTQINHHRHDIHPLSLLPLPDGHTCDVCTRPVKVSYACADCYYDVCVFCAFEQRVIHHEGHKEHALTLMKKEALFQCDACHEKAEDSSYVCTTGEFWIHKSCAFSPSIIPAPTYHHHPLTLIYSIPDIHLLFHQFCGICKKYVQRSYWVYYCHKCTYFVHMKCSTSTIPMLSEDEADVVDNEPDLVRFPLPSQESIFDLIVTQCGKSQVDLKGENSVTMSTPPNDPFIIEKHWSHEIHPLQQLQFTISEDDDDDNDDRRVLICNGCIQPITLSHPSYYACIQRGFFLHSLCATKLPQKLPVGASPFHPNHSLVLQKTDKFYNFVVCGVCDHWTNGFYYHCQTCDMYIDIRCAFLPTRIKHKSHKHHSLVQRPSSGAICSVTGFQIGNGVEYACETCSSFQIHELCEERVNIQQLPYHCSKSDHSFHYYCLGVTNNTKLGGTIKVIIVDKPHTLALVVKSPTRKKSTYTCFQCKNSYATVCLLFECDGCGLLACVDCAIKLLGEEQRSALL